MTRNALNHPNLLGLRNHVFFGQLLSTMSAASFR